MLIATTIIHTASSKNHLISFYFLIIIRNSTETFDGI